MKTTKADQYVVRWLEGGIERIEDVYGRSALKRRLDVLEASSTVSAVSHDQP